MRNVAKSMITAVITTVYSSCVKRMQRRRSQIKDHVSMNDPWVNTATYQALTYSGREKTLNRIFKY